MTRVALEPPAASRRAEFLAAVRRSRMLHRPWVYPPATPDQFKNYLRRFTDGSARGFFVVLAATDELVGVVNLSEIVHGNFQSAYLGYYVFAPHARQGLMAEALGLSLQCAFASIGLHRVEANVQPGNTGSVQLVKKLGFRQEGFSPHYLKVGGRWRDHQRWALLAEEWRSHVGPNPTSGTGRASGAGTGARAGRPRDEGAGTE